MKPQITGITVTMARQGAMLQRSCGMKPQITQSAKPLGGNVFKASKELRHEAADHLQLEGRGVRVVQASKELRHEAADHTGYSERGATASTASKELRHEAADHVAG